LLLLRTAFPFVSEISMRAIHAMVGTSSTYSPGLSKSFLSTTVIAYVTMTNAGKALSKLFLTRTIIVYVNHDQRMEGALTV
jgi:hypothetical protein